MHRMRHLVMISIISYAGISISSEQLARAIGCGNTKKVSQLLQAKSKLTNASVNAWLGLYEITEESYLIRSITVDGFSDQETPTPPDKALSEAEQSHLQDLQQKAITIAELLAKQCDDQPDEVEDEDWEQFKNTVQVKSAQKNNACSTK